MGRSWIIFVVAAAVGVHSWTGASAQTSCEFGSSTLIVEPGDGSVPPAGSTADVIISSTPFGGDWDVDGPQPFPGSQTYCLKGLETEGSHVSMEVSYRIRPYPFWQPGNQFTMPYFVPPLADFGSCGPAGLNMGDPVQRAQYQCQGTTTVVNPVASRGAIRGQVKDASGTGVQSKVCVFHPDVPNPSESKVSDADGQFVFESSVPLFIQNNWHFTIDNAPPPGQLGSQTYIVVPGEGTVQPGNCSPPTAPGAESVQIQSSQMAEVELILDSVSVPDPSIRSCPAVGKPVSIATGNVFLDQTDIDIPGLGAGLSFRRSYNSQNAGSPGLFGPGWTHSYESTLALSGTSITLQQGDGVPALFADAGGTGTYEPTVPFSKESWIVQNGSAFTRHLRRGGSETYDSQGRLTALVDPSGNKTTLARDGSGRLVTITDPSGRTLNLAYAGSQVASLSGPAGVIATYGYSGTLLQSVTYAEGSGYTFTYNANNQLLTIVDAAGVVLESHTYAGDQALTSETSGGQERYTFTYAPNQTTVTDALGNATTYDWATFGGMKRTTSITGPCSSCGGSGSETQAWTYDDKGRPTSHADGDGNTTTYQYDPNTGDLLSETDPLVHSTTYSYDAQGRVITRTNAQGAVTTYTYVPAGPASITETVTATTTRTTSITYTSQGQASTFTDARGKVTTLGYDPAGNLTSIIDPLGNQTTFEYDALGRQTRVVDPVLNATSRTYDARGRVLQVTDPAGQITTYAYDLGGRRTSATDPLGRITQNAYDVHGRLETVTDPLGGVTRYGYDVMSLLTSLTDARGKVTSFEYDAFNRLRRTVYPGGAAEVFAYDPAGRLASRTDRKGVVTTYAYDAASRLLSKSYSDGTPTVTYAYDEVGRVLTVANGSDTLNWSYDLAGQVVSEASATNSSLIEYVYDAAGNRTTLSLNGAAQNGYVHDDASRLTTMTRGADTFVFAYDAASRRTRLTFPNGAVTTYAYDTRSQLTDASTAATDPVTGPYTAHQSAYTYDGAGNRLTKAGTYRDIYSYDALDRLTQVIQGFGPAQTIREQYAYDGVGNRTGAIEPGTWLYNDANQLLSNPSATFQYDANGNQIRKVDASGNWQYEWDAENRLIRVLKDTIEVARYAYDPIGRRLEKAVTGVVTRFLYADEDVIRETVLGLTTRTFVHGPGIDEVLADADAVGRWAFYHVDGLGSTVRTTKRDGSLWRRTRYDGFGNIIGGQTTGVSYTGRDWDAETGLYYYRARYYDAKIGRFLSEDPIRFDSGPNFYTYVANNPTQFIDPSGLIRIKVGGRVITVHANDPDPLPSRPHGHLYPGNQKVNVLTGDIVQNGRIIGNIGAKALARLQVVLRGAGLLGLILTYDEGLSQAEISEIVARVCRLLPDVCRFIREACEVLE